MKLRALTPGDTAYWPAFEAALAAAELPVDDLGAPGQRFFMDWSGGAFGGYARGGEVALLRSLVVEPARRGSGLGADLLAAILDEARRDGVNAAWLLTTTAARFFARHGFAPADRATAPRFIAERPQFTGLCPSSAVLMCRTLL